MNKYSRFREQLNFFPKPLGFLKYRMLLFKLERVFHDQKLEILRPKMMGNLLNGLSF